jgi:competence protein ComEC
MSDQHTTSPAVIHRPAVPMALALIAGIAVGAGKPGYSGWFIGALIPCGAWMVRNIRLRRPGAVTPVLFFVLVGYLSIQPWLAGSLPKHHVSHYTGKRTWRISGVIAEQPDIFQGRWRFVLATDRLQAGRQRHSAKGRLLVSGRGHWPGAVRGDRVIFKGRLRRIRSFANPGGFDYERFLALQAVHARVYARAG